MIEPAATGGILVAGERTVQPQIQFVTAPDGVSLAVATMGNGPPLIIIPGWISHVELDWALPAARDFFSRLAESNLLVRYDKRGTGLSDRDVADFTPEANLSDLRAIIDALDLRGVSLLGYSQGGPIAIAYTVQNPDNVSHLILYGSYHDGTTAYFRDLIDGFVALIKADWGGYGTTAMLDMFVPGLPPDGRLGFVEFQRQAASAETAAATLTSLFDFKVSDLLPEVRTPTLVLHRRGDKTCPFQQGRELAARIPGARFVPLDGDIHVLALGDIEPIVEAIASFLAGREMAPAGPKVREGLQTIVFTDIVGSTELTQRLGDAAAQERVRAHDEAVRSELQLMGGTEIKHTGDGIMASFPSASRAITFAVQGMISVALRNAEQPDKAIQIRIGLNAGEPIAENGDIFGTAVQLARRVCDAAQPMQILATDVVRQLAAGKGFGFVDRGEVELKGIAGATRLYEVQAQGSP
jgi:class 3 adenylate cyclase